MGEVTGAVIATALVLGAVFVPVAFFPGTTGRLYQQFALTIAFSMAISAFNALTLTPALAGVLLSQDGKAEGRVLPRREPRHRRRHRGDGARAPAPHPRPRGRRARVRRAARRRPTGSIRACRPASCPTRIRATSSSSSRRRRARRSSTRWASRSRSSRSSRRCREIQHVFGVGGFSFAGAGPNQGILFCMLKDFAERPGRASIRPRRSSASCSACSARSPARMVFPFLPPSVTASAISAGSSTSCWTRPAARSRTWPTPRAAWRGRRTRRPGLAGVFTQFTADDPQFVVTIDREQAKSLGISLSDITQTMQILLGSAYVNDFDFNNRSYRVYVQADSQFRSNAGRHRALLGAQQRRADDAAEQRGLDSRGAPRRRPSTTTTCSARSRSTGRPRPATARARRWTAMEALSARVLPQGMTFAWARPLARRDRGRQPGDDHLRPRPAARLPDAGGAVRKPDAAVHHSAVGAARHPGRAGRAVGPRAHQRRVLPDRARHADRPVGEERDSDRRVRRAAPPSRDVDRRGRRRGRAHPAAADSDDVAGLHPRRHAARVRERRRPGGAALGRHRGRRRHDCVHVPQPRLHSRCSMSSSRASQSGNVHA